jgi:thiamine biosynthesis lipoprotein
MTSELRREGFRAMGTICEVAATEASQDKFAAPRALAAARAEVAACERALSRFDPDSDLSRVNRADGEWVVVDERLVEVLEAVLRGRRETGGLFDPTVLPVLEAAGYDRSFELVIERPAGRVEAWRAGAWIEIDAAARRVRLEPGAAIDLGGVGKGFAGTRALQAMRSTSSALTGALVDLGGDIAVLGAPPGGGPWRVDIEDPRTAGVVACTLELSAGGVATSGRDRRRFGPGRRLHHLIDPASGAPAVSGPIAVTVTGPSATEAEIYATALAIADLDLAQALLASRDEFGAFYIPADGEPVVIGRLPLVHHRSRARVVVNTNVGRLKWN